MRVRLMTIVAGLALCALVTGCGDSSDSAQSNNGPPVQTSSLSKQEFIRKAGVACDRERTEGVRALSAYAAQNRGQSQEQLLAGAFKSVLPRTVEQEMEAIRKLGAPAGDEEEIGAILVALQEGIDRVRQARSPKSGAEFPSYFAAADEMLEEYGLSGCSRNAS